VIATRDGDTPAPNGDTDAGSAPSIRSDDEPAVAAPVESSTLDNMILHLSDAPEGSRIGDDSYCGGRLGSEGASDSLLALLAARTRQARP
jgi:hypothetical protein